MQRYVLEVRYDGNCFHGSQVQGDLATVQLAVNKALSTLLRESVLTLGASRTDEGVHALSNYYHFDLDRELQPDFLYKCNAVMPHGIAALAVHRALKSDFNARFDAVSRSYRYRIYTAKDPFLYQRALYYPYPIDTATLALTATALKTHTNFESFAKRNAQVKTFQCAILDSRWERVGDELHYLVTANRFLRGMVRGLVATQLRLSRPGGAGVPGLETIFAAQDCRKAFFDVAGFGLYLEKIAYPPGYLQPLFDK